MANMKLTEKIIFIVLYTCCTHRCCWDHFDPKLYCYIKPSF
uniref:Uncharacterized protein n=1 Tax=Anguilla anguilla TaxID=7936 RepID=A0A0E9VBH6_ANGAN